MYGESLQFYFRLYELSRDHQVCSQGCNGAIAPPIEKIYYYCTPQTKVQGATGNMFIM